MMSFFQPPSKIVLMEKKTIKMLAHSSGISFLNNEGGLLKLEYTYICLQFWHQNKDQDHERDHLYERYAFQSDCSCMCECIVDIPDKTVAAWGSTFYSNIYHLIMLK